LDCKSVLGEGPIWDSNKQVLYWVDILQKQVHIFDPVTKQDRSVDVGEHIGTVVVRKSGGLALALRTGFATLDLETGKATLIAARPETDPPNKRFNDGKCDPAGRFWAGTMSYTPDADKGAGSLYVLDKDHKVHRVVEGVTISNGIIWSADHKTMYYIDSPNRTVDAFDYDVTSGNVTNRHPIIILPPGEDVPDGMTIDEKGNLWVAHWGGNKVACYNPHNGELLHTVNVPSPQVTACAFGGKNLDELYITSASVGLDEETLKKYPHAGSLFVVKPGVRGVKSDEYAG